MITKTLAQFLSSKDWTEYFSVLSNTVNFELYVCREDGELFTTRSNPFCNLIHSSRLESLMCPSSCKGLMTESLQAGGPVIFKCKAGIINFSFPVAWVGEKVYIGGRGGFTSYEGLLEFLKLVKTNNLPSLPITMPLNFTGEDHVRAIAQYIFLTVSRLLFSFDERYRLEEKFFRVMSLFDSNTFKTLSRNPELLYRYILDTIEFVYGSTSAALMTLDNNRLTFKSAYGTGKYKDSFTGFQLNAANPLIHEMFSTRTYIFSTDSEKLSTAGPLREIQYFYLFPIFSGDIIEKIIGIFDRRLSKEDLKIMNALRDYLQLHFENRNLRFSANKFKKADERLTYLVDFSNSIISVLSKEQLFNTLIEKSLQLLNAEQGSLMLLDHDTSEFVVEAKKSPDETVQERMRFKKDEGIAGIVLDKGEPLLVNDIEKDPRTRRENRPHYKTKSFISILIKIDDRVTGVLNVSDKIRGDVFTEEDLKLLESLVNNAAIAIERSLLYKQTEELKQLSITDPLTGIYNRRYLNTRLLEEITRYNRYKHPFSFMMLDLDKFKEYNDTFGHIYGDKLIKALATIMEKSMRNVDIAARFGGDEFVAIFPQTSKPDAIQITNRLKENIEKSLQQELLEMTLTVSMGLTTYPDDASSIGELLEKTDQALYIAKKGGGNKVAYL
jgi:diguanylate cyclase (GGDEF)-like protein